MTFMNRALILLALLGVVMASIIPFARFSLGEPGGPTITYVSNSSLDTTAPSNRTDAKGVIHTIDMNAVLQNDHWKAYVGNITGVLTLDDANGFTIYDWRLTAPQGEVYISRDSSITWASIVCGSGARVTAEETALSMQASAVDNINRTFNETIHKSFLVGSINITESSCKTAFTYVNDSRQNPAHANSFTEVLLSDGTDIIYTSLISNDALAYRDLTTYDFQAIVADNVSVTATPAVYYFWIELG